jgi:3-dehydroquinate dehydratase-1
LQIDFVSLSKHEGKMSIKAHGNGERTRDASAATHRNATLSALRPGSVVGIVDSLEACHKALRLPQGAVDFLEWRADCLGSEIPRSKFPWIITARHPAEGGKNSMSTAVRRDLLSALLPVTNIIDIEVRSLAPLRSVVTEANASGVLVLASFHDFKKTPALARLRDIIHRAEDQGANAVKIAAHTETPADVARLLDLFSLTRLPLAVMGMGPLGMASRVVLAGCGSVLNYGWLHEPNVPGQWAARELVKILRQCSVQDRD